MDLKRKEEKSVAGTGKVLKRTEVPYHKDPRPGETGRFSCPFVRPLHRQTYRSPYPDLFCLSRPEDPRVSFLFSQSRPSVLRSPRRPNRDKLNEEDVRQ